MMSRLTTIFILVPIGIIVLMLAIANRQPVTLAVPPDIGGEPFLSATLPLFAVVFIALLAGMIIGSCATWVKQGRYRKQAQEQKVEATKATFEAQKQKERADAVAAKPSAGDEARAKLGLPAPKKAA